LPPPPPLPGPVGEPLLVWFGLSSVAEQAAKQVMPTAVTAASKDEVRMAIPPRMAALPRRVPLPAAQILGQGPCAPAC
jgi:hypothetical protein